MIAFYPSIPGLIWLLICQWAKVVPAAKVLIALAK
jgi:hypothetical protein